MTIKARLREAFGWTSGQDTDWAAMLAAGLGMAGPVWHAALAGHLTLGLVAAVGSLLVGGAATGRSLGEQARNLAAVWGPAAAAAGAAVLVAGRSWQTDAAVVLLAAAAAVIGGWSRPLVAASMRFMPFLVISIGVAETARDRLVLLCLMGSGALWTSVLAVLLGRLPPAVLQIDEGREPAGGSTASAAQHFARWARSLGQLSGWQTALRLAFGLAVGGALRSCWPTHHFLWISLTVVILSQRQAELVPLKVVQRAIGVAVGVAASGVLLGLSLPTWALVAVIGLLATLRPWLRSHSYLLYSACMTPLICVIVDAGQPISRGILVDRLIATMVGAALVIAANAMIIGLLRWAGRSAIAGGSGNR
jgi:hypothetical protein